MEACSRRGSRRLLIYFFRSPDSEMKSLVRKRLLRLPGQSAIAHSKEKWSSHVRREGVMESLDQILNGAGISEWKRRCVRPSVSAKARLVRGVSPAREI